MSGPRKKSLTFLQDLLQTRCLTFSSLLKKSRNSSCRVIISSAPAQLTRDALFLSGYLLATGVEQGNVRDCCKCQAFCFSAVFESEELAVLKGISKQPRHETRYEAKSLRKNKHYGSENVETESNQRLTIFSES